MIGFPRLRLSPLVAKNLVSRPLAVISAFTRDCSFVELDREGMKNRGGCSSRRALIRSKFGRAKGRVRLLLRRAKGAERKIPLENCQEGQKQLCMPPVRWSLGSSLDRSFRKGLPFETLRVLSTSFAFPFPAIRDNFRKTNFPRPFI